jgi:hypothetical protein
MESDMHDRLSDAVARPRRGPDGFVTLEPARALILAVLVFLAVAAPWVAATAQDESRSITLKVMLSHISNEPGSIDKRAAELDEKIRKDFRYESLRVLEEREMRLELSDTGSMTLPNGRQLRVTPMVIDERGALLAVDLEGSTKADLRVKPRHLIVIGAQGYQGGKLVISLLPEF